MPINKEKLREVLDNTQDFQSLGSEGDKKLLLDYADTPERVNEVFGQISDFKDVSSEDKKVLLNYVNETPKYATGALGSLFDKTVGGVISAGSGLAKAGVELGIDAANSFENIVGMGKEHAADNQLVEQAILNHVILPAQQYGEAMKQKAAEYEKVNLSPVTRFLSDTTQLIGEGAAITGVAIATGGSALWANALAFGAKAVGDEYNTMRKANYGPEASALGAAVSGSLMGAAEKIGLGEAFDAGKPIVRRIINTGLKTALTGAGITATGQAINYATDLAMDKLDEAQTHKKLAPGFSWTGMLEGSLRQGAIMGIAGSITPSSQELTDYIKIRARGVNRTYVGDGYVYHPDSIPQKTIKNAAERVKVYAEKAGKKVTDMVNLALNPVLQEAKINTEIAHEVIKNDEQVPLKDIIHNQANPQVERARPVSMESGSSVGVMPNIEELQTLYGQKLVTPVRGKIVGFRKDKDGKKVYQVQMEDVAEGPGMLNSVPEDAIVDFDKTVERLNYNRKSLEAAPMMALVNSMIVNGRPLEDLTPEEQAMALGAWLGVGSNLAKGAYGATKGSQGVLDRTLNAQDPLMSKRVLAHKIGHKLAESTPQQMLDSGLEALESFRGFLQVDPENMGESFADFAKSLGEGKTPETATKKDIANFFYKTYGEDIDLINKEWGLFPTKKPKQNLSEDLAEALSAFLNKPKMSPDDPITQTKLYGDFLRWIDSQPATSKAWRNYVDTIENTKAMGMNAELDKMFTDTDKVKIEQEKRNKAGTGLGAYDRFVSAFLNDFHPIYKEINNADIPQDIKDEMINDIESFVNSSDVPITFLNKIINKYMGEGVDMRNLNLKAFHDRVINDRQKKSIIGLSNEKMKQELREELSKDTSLTKDEIDEAIDKTIAEEGNTILEKTYNLLNPRNITPEQSIQGLSEIEGQIGTKEYDKLSKAKDFLHKTMLTDILPTLRSSGSYSEKTLKHIQDNEDYAFFDVVKHEILSQVRKRIPQGKGLNNGIHSQEGTLSDISSPITATLEKYTQMYHNARKAKVLRDTLQGLTLAKSTQVKKLEGADLNKVYKGKDKQRVDIAYYNSEDKLIKEHYLVDNSIMWGFDKVSNKSQQLFTRTLSNAGNFVKKALTMYQPAFWGYNFIRDLNRTTFNLPGIKSYSIIPQALKEVAKQMGYNIRGEVNPEKEALSKKGVLTGGTYGNRGRRERLQSRLDEIKTLKDSKQVVFGLKRYFKSIGGLKEFMEDFGDAVEYSTKKAGHDYLVKRNKGKALTPRQEIMLRNEIGSPMFSKGGTDRKILGNLILFYNPMVQGYSSDYQNFKRDPINFMGKRLAYTFTRLSALALLAHTSPEFKELLRRIPNYQWLSKYFIPVGITADGKASYLSFPMDETTQLINSIVANTIFRPLMDDSIGLGEAAKNTLQGMQPMVPQLNPILKIGGKVFDYATTGNMTDSLTGQKVIPDRVVKSNQTAEKVKCLTQYLYDSAGALPQLLPLNFTSKDKYSDTFQDVPTFISKIPILKKFFRVSSYGLTERVKRKADAKDRLKNDTYFNFGVVTDHLLAKIKRGEHIGVEDVKGLAKIAKNDPAYFTRAMSVFNKKAAVVKAHPVLEAAYKAYTDARTKAQSDAAVKQLAESYNVFVAGRKK